MVARNALVNQLPPPLVNVSVVVRKTVPPTSSVTMLLILDRVLRLRCPHLGPSAKSGSVAAERKSAQKFSFRIQGSPSQTTWRSKGLV
jgi:hypothetical protein